MYIEITELRKMINEDMDKLLDSKFKALFNKFFGIGQEEIVQTLNDTMSSKEVCKFLDVSRTTLNKYIRERKIISKKQGNHRVFVRSYIIQYNLQRSGMYKNKKEDNTINLI